MQTWCQYVAHNIDYHIHLQKMDNIHKKRAILPSKDEKRAKNDHFVSKKKPVAHMSVAIAPVQVTRMYSCMAHFIGHSVYFQTILGKFGFLKMFWYCGAPFPNRPK